MKFQLDDSLLSTLWRKSNYAPPEDKMLFFGLRGCLPEKPQDQSKRSSHMMRLADIDHRHLRCTIGQWIPGKGITLFAASTVPWIKYVKSSKGKGGSGTNQLMRGLLRYRKGYHGYQSDYGHSAFRQDMWFPIRRTKDDLDYDNDDSLDNYDMGSSPHDNLHAARCISIDHDEGFASAGCQVVAGYAKGNPTQGGSLNGPWKTFQTNAYNLDQKVFLYALFGGYEASTLASQGKASSVLRYGSQGNKVEELQGALKEAGYYKMKVDGDFGKGTLHAAMDYQTDKLGPHSDDGIIGPVTASELGIDLPTVSLRKSYDDSNDESPVEPVVIPSNLIRPEIEDDDEGEDIVTASVETRYQTENGRRAYYASVNGSNEFFVGKVSKYKSNRGLSNGRKGLTGGVYNPAEWEAEFGLWAWFIYPTGQGESKNRFGCINSYDRAKFTYGFYQFAAHTPNDNLILLFRRLLELPEASHYFPDLTLIDGKVHRIKTTGNTESLETVKSIKLSRWTEKQIPKFMSYFNPDLDQIDGVEVETSAKLMHWAANSVDVRHAQISLAIETAKKKLRWAVKKGVPIEGRSAEIAIWCSDNLHQGRTKYSQLKTVLKKAKPTLNDWKTVGRSENYTGRINTVSRMIRELKSNEIISGVTYQNNDLS